MTERWQERRVENELLKRELLLRLRAEQYGVPGRGEPATDHFRRQVRRLLLLHPLFALKLYLLLIDVGLGRAEGRKRSYRRGSVTRIGTKTASSAGLRRGVPGRSRRARRDLGLAYRKCELVVAGLGAHLRRQRSLWYQRLGGGLRICKAACTAGLATLRRQSLLWFARLVHAVRVCRSLAAALAVELRRAGTSLFALVIRTLRT